MKKIFIGLMMCILVGSALGEIMISEIMYDPSGNEAKEWIELYNNGNSSVDMTGWKINDGTTKNLTLYLGNVVLQQDSFAIISKSAENFTKEYPSYVGTVYEATFSLTNSGKEISLLDKAGNLADKVKYTDISDEDSSVEIRDSSLDSSVFENWIAGTFRGDPGNIRRTQASVPEFGTFGAIVALIGCAIIFLRKG